MLLLGVALLVALAIVVVIVENLLSYLYIQQFGLPILAWTLIVFFVLYILSLFNLLILWGTHSYVLMDDSLEIKVGLIPINTSMIVSTGFSDLEFIRSITSRLLNTGDILIRTQSERNFTKSMVMVKDAPRIANMIREVIARQIFKMDNSGSEKYA
jgi:uncharacterized membrane protein YdbT with pleckstrin-like domain